jgi:hypothetical protein
MSMTFIAKVTVTGSPADISLTNIPQTFTDLYILVSARARTTANPNALGISANGYAQTNSLFRYLRGTGSGVGSSNGAANVIGSLTDISSSQYNSVSIYLPNYTSSGTKSAFADSVTENNGTTAYQEIIAQRFDVASAITSLQFGDSSAGGGLGVGSEIFLYGILKGSGGATVS